MTTPAAPALAMPWLDLTVACQRHTLKSMTYVTARPPFDPSRFGVEAIVTADARTFVETHHYSGTFPVEIASYGLFESRPNARAALVGVAVFSIPVNTPRELTALLEPGQAVCDLGRFIINDHVLANAETWFLARGARYLARALDEGPFHRIKHRGNHRYVLLPPARALRRKILGAFPALPYPKRTDPLPEPGRNLDRALASGESRARAAP